MSNTHTATVASDLMEELGKDFSLPDVNLSDAEFQIPESSDFVTGPSRVDIDELTTGIVGGSGAYDKIMASNLAHLQSEYEKGRITGEQFTRAYVELTTASLSSAVQMVLQRDTTYWQSKMVQMQGRRAEIEAVIAKVELEKTKADLVAAQRQAALVNAQYVLTQMQTALADVQFRQIENQMLVQDAQRLSIEKDTEIADYRLTVILPKESDQLTAQTALTGSQRDAILTEISIADFRLTDLMPKESLQMVAQTSLTNEQKAAITKDIQVADYRLLNMMPKEVEQITAQIDMTEAQKGSILKDTEIANFRLAELMPKEALQLTAQTTLTGAQQSAVLKDVDLADYRLTTLMPRESLQMEAQTALVSEQKAAITKDIDIADFRLTQLMPQEVDQVAAQRDLTDAQKAAIIKDVEIADFRLNQLMPKEADQLEAQIALTSAQKTGVETETDISAYRLSYTLPQELLNLGSQKELLDEQADTERSRKLTQDSQTHVNQKQASFIHEQTCHEEIKKNLTNHQIALTREQTETQRGQTMDVRMDGSPVSGVLKRQKDVLEQEVLAKAAQVTLVHAQVDLTTEQTESQRGQTLNTRTNGETITGILGMQKDLYGEQIVSYQKDSRQKVAKLYADAYITQQTINDAVTPPAEFNQDGINSVLLNLRNNNL